MYPFFTLWNREIASFGIMVLFGIGAGYLTALFNCKLKGVKSLDPMLVACISMVGVIIGAKMIRPIMKLPDLIINWEKYISVPPSDFFSWYFGETVFYGGLIGGLLAAYIYCRNMKVPFLDTADILAPAILVGHAVGRFGCLLAGCCYGIEVDPSHPFSIYYPERHDALAAVTAPPQIPILAIPVIEAAGNIIIALLILYVSTKIKKTGLSLVLYGILYGIQRFILEFFRDDTVRGIYYGISTSQIISIIIVALAIALFIRINNVNAKINI